MTPLYFFTDRMLAATVIPILPRRLSPNHLTTFRFLTVPVIFFLLVWQDYFWSAIVFIIAVFSDALDGALARTTNQISDWGKLFDPLADKLLIGSTAALLVSRFISFRLAVAIVAIELLLILFAYHHKYYRQQEIQANYLGKTKMVLQSVGLIVLYAGIIVANPFLIQLSEITLTFALGFAALSFFGYRSI